MRRGAVVALAFALVVAAVAAHRLRSSPGRDLFVVLDGGSSRLQQAERFQRLVHPLTPELLLIRCPRTPPPVHPVSELLQGYDTATQITALAI